jgi:tetratricopeptide (TPR) repeat protein
MSIKNLIKFLFYLFIIAGLQISSTGREPYDWTYNFEKGKKQFSAKMYNDALDNMNLALKKNTASFESANFIARIYLIKKDFYSAEKYFLMSLEINDNQSDTHQSMGEIDEYFRRDESAMNHYKKSVSLDPENPVYLLSLSRIYYINGRISESEQYYNLAREKGMTQSMPVYAKAMELKRENPELSVQEFHRAIELNPAHLEAYIGLSDAYRQAGFYDQAIDTLEKLKKNKPDFVLAYIHLGNIYYNNKPDMKTRKYYISLAIKN